jgi:hypothetical protein
MKCELPIIQSLIQAQGQPLLGLEQPFLAGKEQNKRYQVDLAVSLAFHSKIFAEFCR